MKQLEDESKARTDKRFVAEQAEREQETPRVGRLLLLYVDDTVTDTTPFGDVRQHAFKIMPREALQIAGQRPFLSVAASGPAAGVVRLLLQRAIRHEGPPNYAHAATT